jgi:hypothetical protein
MKFTDGDIELAADVLVSWVMEQVKLRVAVKLADDDLRRKGLLLYAAPEAMR